MNRVFRKLMVLFKVTLFLLIFVEQVLGQEVPQTGTSKRAKENFDFNWQFHKGNIAMKRSIKAGGQGGFTDANVKMITTRDTTIDYTDVKTNARR